MPYSQIEHSLSELHSLQPGIFSIEHSCDYNYTQILWIVNINQDETYSFTNKYTNSVLKIDNENYFNILPFDKNNELYSLYKVILLIIVIYIRFME